VKAGLEATVELLHGHGLIVVSVAQSDPGMSLWGWLEQLAC